MSVAKTLPFFVLVLVILLIPGGGIPPADAENEAANPTPFFDWHNKNQILKNLHDSGQLPTEKYVTAIIWNHNAKQLHDLQTQSTTDSVETTIKIKKTANGDELWDYGGGHTQIKHKDGSSIEKTSDGKTIEVDKFGKRTITYADKTKKITSPDSGTITTIKPDKTIIEEFPNSNLIESITTKPNKVKITKFYDHGTLTENPEPEGGWGINDVQDVAEFPKTKVTVTNYSDRTVTKYPKTDNSLGMIETTFHSKTGNADGITKIQEFGNGFKNTLTAKGAVTQENLKTGYKATINPDNSSVVFDPKTGDTTTTHTSGKIVVVKQDKTEITTDPNARTKTTKTTDGKTVTRDYKAGTETTEIEGGNTVTEDLISGETVTKTPEGDTIFDTGLDDYGSIRIVKNDGTEITQNRDGSYKTTKSEGKTVTESSSATTTVTKGPGGGKITKTEYKKTGDIQTIDENGTIVTEGATEFGSGPDKVSATYKTTRTPNGDGTYTQKTEWTRYDGKKLGSTTTYADGRTVTVHPDRNLEITTSGETKVYRNLKTGTVEFHSADGKTKTITKGTQFEVHKTLDDGSLSITTGEIYISPPRPSFEDVPPLEPTSVEPTSVEPTSVEPTSVEPTSVEPTSVEPTSEEPEMSEDEWELTEEEANELGPEGPQGDIGSEGQADTPSPTPKPTKPITKEQELKTKVGKSGKSPPDQHKDVSTTKWDGATNGFVDVIREPSVDYTIIDPNAPGGLNTEVHQQYDFLPADSYADLIGEDGGLYKWREVKLVKTGKWIWVLERVGTIAPHLVHYVDSPTCSHCEINGLLQPQQVSYEDINASDFGDETGIFDLDISSDSDLINTFEDSTAENITNEEANRKLGENKETDKLTTSGKDKEYWKKLGLNNDPCHNVKGVRNVEVTAPNGDKIKVECGPDKKKIAGLMGQKAAESVVSVDAAVVQEPVVPQPVTPVPTPTPQPVTPAPPPPPKPVTPTPTTPEEPTSEEPRFDFEMTPEEQEKFDKEQKEFERELEKYEEDFPDSDEEGPEGPQGDIGSEGQVGTPSPTPKPDCEFPQNLDYKGYDAKTNSVSYHQAGSDLVVYVYLDDCSKIFWSIFYNAQIIYTSTTVHVQYDNGDTRDIDNPPPKPTMGSDPHYDRTQTDSQQSTESPATQTQPPAPPTTSGSGTGTTSSGECNIPLPPFQESAFNAATGERTFTAPGGSIHTVIGPPPDCKKQTFDSFGNKIALVDGLWMRTMPDLTVQVATDITDSAPEFGEEPGTEETQDQTQDQQQDQQPGPQTSGDKQPPTQTDPCANVTPTTGTVSTTLGTPTITQNGDTWDVSSTVKLTTSNGIPVDCGQIEIKIYTANGALVLTQNVQTNSNGQAVINVNVDSGSYTIRTGSQVVQGGVSHPTTPAIKTVITDDVAAEAAAQAAAQAAAEAAVGGTVSVVPGG